MANEPKSNDERDRLAERIFTQRATARNVSEKDAIEAFRHADTFLAARKKIASGEIKTAAPEGVQLAECCCPNQPRTHPHNLVARIFDDGKGGEPIPGDLGKIKTLHAWLERNPTPERNPEEVVHRINRQFSELNWDLDMLTIARAIFPAYCKN